MSALFTKSDCIQKMCMHRINNGTKSYFEWNQSPFFGWLRLFALIMQTRFLCHVTNELHLCAVSRLLQIVKTVKLTTIIIDYRDMCKFNAILWFCFALTRRSKKAARRENPTINCIVCDEFQRMCGCVWIHLIRAQRRVLLLHSFYWNFFHLI